jgi:transcriptional regulator with XRE-family HTH domain
MNTVYYEFAPECLRVRRQEKGLSLQELARRVGMAKPTVTNYENGWRTPAPPIVMALATVLDCDPEDLTVPVRWNGNVDR